MNVPWFNTQLKKLTGVISIRTARDMVLWEWCSIDETTMEWVACIYGKILGFENTHNECWVTKIIFLN